jgi:hypothetical protein
MRFFLGSSKDEQDGNQEESSDEDEGGDKQDSRLFITKKNLFF